MPVNMVAMWTSKIKGQHSSIQVGHVTDVEDRLMEPKEGIWGKQDY